MCRKFNTNGQNLYKFKLRIKLITIHDMIIIFYYIVLYYIILCYIILYYKRVGREVIAKLLAKSYLIFFLVRKDYGGRENLDVDGSMVNL
jgi:hypothetical protein